MWSLSATVKYHFENGTNFNVAENPVSKDYSLKFGFWKYSQFTIKDKKNYITVWYHWQKLEKR